MRSFKHPSATNSKPTIVDAGTAGYCKNGTPGDPTSFTTLPVSWVNDLIDEIQAAATGDGEVALDSADPKQIHKRLGGAAAIKSSNGVDTGTVTNTHRAFVIGSSLSGADPDTGDMTGVIGCFGSFTNAEMSYLIGSINTELAESGVVGMGWGATGIIKAGVNQNVKIRFYPQTGVIKVFDVILDGFKATYRNVPIAGAQCIGSAGDWVLNGPPVTGQTILHWTPSAAGKYLAVPLPNRVGEHVDTVNAYVKCNVTSGSKVRGRVYATNATGTFEVSDEVEWTYASDGAKALTCNDHVYVSGRTYYVAFWVDGGDTAPTNAAEGLFWIRENGAIEGI